MRAVPWRLVLAALALAAAAFGAAAWLLSPVVRLGPGAGEWREVTAGVRWVPGSDSLTGIRRVLVHFHHLTTEPTEVVLVVARRRPADALHLDVRRDGAHLFRVEAPATPSPVIVPVRAGLRDVDVVVEASPAAPGARTAYRIHEVVLRRQASPARRLWQAVPALLGAAVLVLARRRVGLLEATAWGALAAAGALATAVVIADPNAALRLLPATRLEARWAILFGVWVLAWLRPRPAGALAAVLATAAGLYLPTVHYGFVNEDFNFARPWSAAELAATLHGSWAPQGGVAVYYRPLVSWSFALDHAVWGTWAPGYHLTNLLIHGVSGALAVALLADLGLPLRAAMAGALAWLVHPLSATAVAWTNERTDGLAVLFMLAALVALVRPRLPVPRRPAVLLAAALALASKEVAATLPVTAALCAYAAGGRAAVSERGRALAALAGLVLAYVVFWIVLFPEKLARVAGGQGWEGAEGIAGAAAWLRVAGALYALVFVPIVDYEQWRALAVTDIGPFHLLGGVLLPLLIWAALRRAGRDGAARIALLGLVWPCATVMPLLAIPEVDLFRLGLVVALGFAFAWGAGLSALDRHPAATGALALAVMAGLMLPAGRTAAVWGPRGSMKAELPLWRAHVGERWWNSLTPEMQRRFAEEVALLGHERRLMDEE